MARSANRRACAVGRPLLLASVLLAGSPAGAMVGAQPGEPEPSPAPAQRRSIGDLLTPGDTATWWVEIEGERIGHNSTRYEGPVALSGELTGAHLFREQVELDAEVPGGRLVQRYTTRLWTDAHARPLRLEFRAAVSDVRSAIDAVVEGSTMTARIRQGPSERRQEIELGDEVILLANNFVSHLDLALAVSAPQAGQQATIPLFSVNVLRPFPLVLTPLESEEGDPGARFRDSLGETLVLDARGRLERVEVPAQKLVFRRAAADEAAPEWFEIDLPGARAPATDLEREDVTIEYDGVSIAGSVTKPPAVGRRLPAVFFISGSGGQDREGNSSGVDVGTWEILDRLTREGFLVLRVDDRGVGESTGPGNVTFDDLVEDARQAVQYLRGRDDVDASRIALLGHSEGGQTAPILAAEMDLGAVVLLAAPGRPVTTLLREQLLRGKELMGASDEELTALAAQIDSFFAALSRGEEVSVDDLPPELAAFVGGRAWLESHMRQDPVANLARVEEPVLILQGGRDVQVLADRDATALEAALEAAGHPDFELVVLPQLDHLFKRTEGGDGAALDYLKDRPVDEEFLDLLVAWLKARLMPAAAQ